MHTLIVFLPFETILRSVISNLEIIKLYSLFINLKAIGKTYLTKISDTQRKMTYF